MAVDGFDFSKLESDYAFYIFNFQEELYKKLPSYILYQEFNKNTSSSTYSDYCTNVKTNGVDKNTVKELCKKFAKNLKELSTIRDIGNTMHNRCLGLRYWIYHELNKILTNSEYSSHREHIINSFSNLESKIYYELLENRKETCPIEIKDHLVKENEKKFLYDYFSNYSALIECINSPKKENCQKYCKYINGIKDIYTRNEEKCCGANFWRCDYFNCNGKYHPHVLLYKLQCNNGKNELESSGNKMTDYEGKYGNSGLVKRLRYNIFKCHMVKVHENFDADVGLCSVFPSSKDSYENVDNPESSKPEEGKCPDDKPIKTADGKCTEPNVRTTGAIGVQLLDKGPISRVRIRLNDSMNDPITSVDYNTTDFNNSDDKYSILNSNIMRMIIVGILTFGIIMTFFIYFKFTPFGPWLRRKIIKEKKMTRKIPDKSRQRISYSAQPPRNANSNKRRVNIVY
ncbi:variable surface protein [Plasmodium gonderi]|uniref:Variable surface protein n=1 Tax=Plasmodium gonderi TaxID=77519 RepID=A0A1Y1JCV6_PLAGO|nr:variable surface protein [Plasmodium gonderi]GAW79037.1 variable surface protein [Plasmodium gonderi]